MNYRQRYFIVKEQNRNLYYASNPNCRNILQGQYFFKNKPKGTYRIFTFGGSTTEGSIHQGKVSFTKFLEWKLKNLLPSENIEVINFGKAGEASRQVLEKIKVVLKYDPDLFIVYSAHNEFIRFFDKRTVNNVGWIEDILEKFYLYKKILKRFLGKFIDQTPLHLIETRRLEDKLICSPEEYEEVRKEYKRNIEEIVRISRDSKVDIILSSEVGNYKSWEPNRSFHGNNLSDSELKKWRYHFTRGREFQENGEFELAVKEFELSKKIDGAFAELNYQLAKCYEHLGLFEKAKKEYLNAVDNDGDPKVASSFFNKTIMETCQNYQIPCVDVIGAFERASENSLIGYNIMVDGQHPSLFGELLIAKEIIKVIAENSLPKPAQQWSFENDKSDEWYMAKPDVKNADNVLYHQNRGLWFAKLATMRYDPRDRLQRARYHFDRAHEIDPDSFRTYIGYAVLNLLEGKSSEAIFNIQKACEINPLETTKVRRDIWISSLLFRSHIRVSEECR